MKLGRDFFPEMIDKIKMNFPVEIQSSGKLKF
jgi:hypothetical protein